MEKNGIVRKIDELGRIVIPKEIRRSLNIKSSDDIEISYSDNNIILRKYERLLNLSEAAQKYVNIFSKLINCDIIVCDLDRVVACLNNNYLNMEINTNVINLIRERKASIYEGELFGGVSLKCFILPLIVDTDLIGASILCSKNDINDDVKIIAFALNALLSDLIYW